MGQIQQAFADGEIPEITISNGIAEVSGEQPFIMLDGADANGQSMFVAVDTTGKIKKIDTGYSQGFLLTRTELHVVNPQNGYQVVPLSDINTMFSQDPIIINAQTTSQAWGVMSIGICDPGIYLSCLMAHGCKIDDHFNVCIDPVGDRYFDQTEHWLWSDHYYRVVCDCPSHLFVPSVKPLQLYLSRRANIFPVRILGHGSCGEFCQLQVSYRRTPSAFMDRPDRLANAALIHCGYLLAIPLSLRCRRPVGSFPADRAGVDWLAPIFPIRRSKTFTTFGIITTIVREWARPFPNKVDGWTSP